LSYTPISNCLPQYSSGSIPALDRYIKFYAAGTTTPILGATDATGGTLVDKFRINSDGYPVNATNDHTIPHIDQAYKIAFFLTEADADANDLNNADWVIDNMEPVETINSSPAIESETLMDGQTAVVTTNGDVDSSLFISGILADNGRLAKDVDYSFDSGIMTYNLTQSYPEDTILTILP